MINFDFYFDHELLGFKSFVISAIFQHYLGLRLNYDLKSDDVCRYELKLEVVQYRASLKSN